MYSNHYPMIRPKFIPKKYRNTIIEDEERTRSLKRQLLENARFKSELSEKNRSELDLLLNKNKEKKQERCVLDDKDDIDSVDEYELWKMRELNRLKQEYLEYNSNDQSVRNRVTDLQVENCAYEKKNQIIPFKKIRHEGSFFQNAD